MDGACADWVEHHDYTRQHLRDLLMGTLYGALIARGAGELLNA